MKLDRACLNGSTKNINLPLLNSQNINTVGKIGLDFRDVIRQQYIYLSLSRNVNIIIYKFSFSLYKVCICFQVDSQAKNLENDAMFAYFGTDMQFLFPRFLIFPLKLPTSQ